MQQNESWERYVHYWRRSISSTQVGFVAWAGQRNVTIQQSKLSRWEAGKSLPDGAAEVRQFADLIGRSTVEAFVAAGMLTVAEAQMGLTTDSLELLAALGVTGES